MLETGLIGEIDINDKSTWENKIFITFDVDWAHDEVIKHTSNILSESNIKATWFITHDTPILNELRENPLFELGIHPNFNPLLLNGSYEKGKNAKEIIQNILKFVPEAKSIRSHSLTQNSSLVQYYKELGLKYELNMLIHYQQNIPVVPFEHHSELIQVPHIWEDDVHMLYGLDYNDALKRLLGISTLKYWIFTQFIFF